MTGSSDAPAPEDILVLGALSKVPEEDETTVAGFDLFSGISDILGSTSSAVVGAVAGSGVFPGLAAVRAESTAIAQVVGRADDIADSYPPVWYLNFPPEISESVRGDLRERSQAFLDFKSWASLKWWSNVFQQLPSSNDPMNKLMQSGLFVRIAMQDLPQTPWLRSIRQPTVTSETLTTPVSDLHDRILDLSMRNFRSLDQTARDAMEPILKRIVRSASAASVDYNDEKMVLAEKHEYRGQGTIMSTIRQIYFAIGESFYDVQQGKDNPRRFVRCKVDFAQYEAEFDMIKWRAHSATISDASKKACLDFVKQQTIDIPVGN